MSLRAQFAAGVTSAFDAFGDVVLDAIYTQKTPVYQAGGEALVAETQYDVRVIQLEVKTDELASGEVSIENATFMCETTRLPVVILAGDSINIAGKEYTINGFVKDPAGATTTIEVSRA